MRSLVAAFAIAACVTPHAIGPQAPVGILRHVPADTPYFYATLEPVPAVVVAGFYRNARPLTEAYLNEIGRDKLGRLLKSFLQSMGDFSASTLDATGLGSRPVFTIYGQGVWPVLRWQVADVHKVDALLAHIAAGAGATQQKMGDTVYYTVVEYDAEVAFGVSDGALVATMIPTSQANDVLPFVIGDKLPEHPMAEADVVKIGAAHDLTKMGIGWIDVARVAAVFLDVHDPLREQLVRANAELPAPTVACRDELSLIAAAMPRIVFGVNKLDTKMMAFDLDVDLSPLVQAVVRSLVVELPPVPDSLGGFFAGSGGIDLQRLRDLVDRRFECELLQGANEWTRGLDELLDDPIVRTVRGTGFVVKKLEVKKLPPVVSALVVVTTSDPQALLKEADRWWTGVGDAPLLDDGKAVTAVSPLGSAGHTWLALRGDNLGLAVGDAMDAPLESVVGATAAPASFLHVRLEPVKLLQALKYDRAFAHIAPWNGEIRLDVSPSASGLRAHYEADLPTD